MTISSASKLVNSRVPALQSLIRRHLLHPSAAAAAAFTNPVPDAHLVDAPRLAEDLYPRFRSSFVTTNFKIEESNSPLCFNAPFRFSVMRSEVARKLGGNESGALANGDANANPKGRKASYDSYSDSEDSDADDHHRDPCDIDAPGDDFSGEEDDFSERDFYSDDEDKIPRGASP